METRDMAVCTGRGGLDGGHCCWVAGQVCELLDQSGLIPRCSVWGRWDEPVYTESPAGQYFAERYPGYSCADWPQNIPEVMAHPSIGKCCWNPPVPVEIH